MDYYNIFSNQLRFLTNQREDHSQRIKMSLKSQKQIDKVDESCEEVSVTIADDKAVMTIESDDSGKLPDSLCIHSKLKVVGRHLFNSRKLLPKND